MKRKLTAEREARCERQRLPLPDGGGSTVQSKPIFDPEFFINAGRMGDFRVWLYSNGTVGFSPFPAAYCPKTWRNFAFDAVAEKAVRLEKEADQCRRWLAAAEKTREIWDK